MLSHQLIFALSETFDELSQKGKFCFVTHQLTGERHKVIDVQIEQHSMKPFKVFIDDPKYPGTKLRAMMHDRDCQCGNEDAYYFSEKDEADLKKMISCNIMEKEVVRIEHFISSHLDKGYERGSYKEGSFVVPLKDYVNISEESIGMFKILRVINPSQHESGYMHLVLLGTENREDLSLITRPAMFFRVIDKDSIESYYDMLIKDDENAN